MKNKIILFTIVIVCIFVIGFSLIMQQSKNLVKNVTIDHIFIITMENKEYSDIVGNTDAPYLNSLIKTYSFADHYSAVSHPSLPNYLALIGGDTFGITSDCTDCYVHAPDLIDQLDTGHKSWKAYMESMPSVCFRDSTDDYAQKHNPFIYFDDIREDLNRCKHIVPYTQLSTDLQLIKSTPNFIWISPNLCNDMHNCSVDVGDKWLSREVPVILHSPSFTEQHSLLIITWDESENSENNHIPTIFIGNTVKRHFISHTSYNHYSLLHTIESIWNLSPLTQNVAKSAVIKDIF